MATITELRRAPTTSARQGTTSGSVLRRLRAAACWAGFLLAAVLAALLAAWTLLGYVLLGQGPSANAGKVLPILAGLLVVIAILGPLIARNVASWRRVRQVAGLVLVVVSVAGVTWALSAPDEALYFARDMAWGGADAGGTRDSQTFPQRAISNGPAAYHFARSPSPPLFQTIQYQQGGQPKQASLNDFLTATQTTAFIVIKDGAILQESYANGYARDSINTSYSVAKSFASAMIGIAIGEGYIGSVNDPMVAYLPELRGRGLDAVTIRDLLRMSAGLAFVHQAAQPPPLQLVPLNDDTPTTYYPDIRSLALAVRPGADRPGTAFEYNKKVPALLGMILERTTHRPVSQYLLEKIWQPVGMEYPASWSLDSTQFGFERMESGLNARAIDFAKFGQLYLDNGRWNGRQVVPAQWVSDSTAPGPADTRPWRVMASWREASGYYGYLWWGRTRPDGSYAYMAWGDFGQFIYVSPKDRVVIVRNGLHDGGIDSWADVFQSIVNAVSR